MEGRLLPPKLVHKILSIYAFHAHKITRLTCVHAKSNKTKRTFKCPTCVDKRHWSETVVGGEKNYWQVQPTYINDKTERQEFGFSDRYQLTTTIKCTCNAHVKKPISDQLFFNISVVKQVTCANHTKPPKVIDELISHKVQAQLKVPPHILSSANHRRKAISQLMVVNAKLLRRDYFYLPTALAQLHEANCITLCKPNQQNPLLLFPFNEAGFGTGVCGSAFSFQHSI